MLTDVTIKIGDEVVARLRPEGAGILEALLENSRAGMRTMGRFLMRVHSARTVGLELGPARVEALLDALKRQAASKCWLPAVEFQPAWAPLMQARDQAHVPRLTNGELANMLGAVDHVGDGHPARGHRKALAGALEVLGYHRDADDMGGYCSEWRECWDVSNETGVWERVNVVKSGVYVRMEKGEGIDDAVSTAARNT